MKYKIEVFYLSIWIRIQVNIDFHTCLQRFCQRNSQFVLRQTCNFFLVKTLNIKTDSWSRYQVEKWQKSHKFVIKSLKLSWTWAFEIWWAVFAHGNPARWFDQITLICFNFYFAQLRRLPLLQFQCQQKISKCVNLIILTQTKKSNYFDAKQK